MSKRPPLDEPESRAAGHPGKAFRRILCPVDFSGVTPEALSTALRLVDAFDAELILFHAAGIPYESAALEHLRREVEDDARLRLADLETDCRGEGRQVRSVVLEDHPPHDAIVSFAESQQVDLIVMPSHSRRGLDRVLTGSVTERVVQASRCAVLVVPPRGDRTPLAAPDGLVVGTDFSEQSDAVLPTIASIAMRLGTSMILAHVVTLSARAANGGAWPSLVPARLEREVLEEARECLAQRVAAARAVGASVEGQLIRGLQPAADLAALAEERGAAMLAVASHGHSRVVAALLGSTAAKLVRCATVPVLVARSNG